MSHKAVFQRILVPIEYGDAPEDGASTAQIVRVGERSLEIPTSTVPSLAMAAGLAAPDGKIRLFHATPSLNHPAIYGGPEGVWIPQETVQELFERASAASKDILTGLGNEFCPDSTFDVAVHPGPPELGILNEIGAFEPDLVVIGASGRGRVSRFVLGSTADKVIRRAPCPTLVVPTPSPEA